MSKQETPMILAYWQQVGGTLLEEFLLVERGPDRGPRRADAVILPDGERRQVPLGQRKVSLAGRDVIVVQAKAERLGMYLLGQAVFSRALAMILGARSARSVALCKSGDAVLEPLAVAHGVEVVVLPQIATF